MGGRVALLMEIRNLLIPNSQFLIRKFEISSLCPRCPPLLPAPVAPSPRLCQDDTVAEAPAYDVVIVTYNHAATLPACLAAVARLAPAPRRVTLIDNASADGSAEIAEAPRARLALEVVREPLNTGFAAAANRGIGAGEAPWVLLLNPDCAPQPDMVRRLADAVASAAVRRSGSARRPPSCGARRGRISRRSRSSTRPGMLVTASGRHLDRGAGRADDGSFDRPAWVFGGTGAAALYRREALSDVAYPGGEVFAESFFAYREDAELSWRLQLRGWRCLYAPGAVAAHRRGFRPEAGRAGHAAINRHSVRNRFLLRGHCADFAWHLRCFPWWLLRDLLVVGACLTVERSSLPGLADVWRLGAEVRERRRWVLGRRTVSPRRIARWFRRRGWTEEVAGP
jgi:GT2 family glycosyltransferase